MENDMLNQVCVCYPNGWRTTSSQTVFKRKAGRPIRSMHALDDLFDRVPWIRCTVAVGPGWHSFAADVLEAIASLTRQYDAEVFVDEIYEKFGTLRLRASSESEAVEFQLTRIEDEAGARSLTICDVCGARGCLRKDGWLRVRCDAHAAFAPDEI